jgi:phosphohistidine phosphatase SixA
MKWMYLLALCGLSAANAAFAEPTLVLLVRHAERAAEPAADPGLTAAGQLRAQALAAALEHSGLAAIITTEFARSRETAAVVALQRGIQAEVVTARGSDAAGHIAAVVAALRRHSGVVLVVGHSNTVPAIAAALGAPKLPDLCETSFSHLWAWQPAAGGSDAAGSLLRLRYGAADQQPPGAACQ